MGLKTKLITTDKARLLVVGGLPGNAENMNITDCDDNWQLLGKLHEISEEQWDSIIDEPFWEDDHAYIVYKDYTEPSQTKDLWTGGILHTATESGLSLIEANCKLRNNVPPPDPDDGEYYDAIDENYEHEQESVFTNPVVFIEKL